MTIGELIEVLETMDPEKTAFVELWKTAGTSEEFEVIDISDNNGHAQLNIHEEHDDAN